MTKKDEPGKRRAPRNRTLDVTRDEASKYRKRLLHPERLPADCRNRMICGDAFEVLGKLPAESVDLLFADPPYNLTKAFGARNFKQRSLEEYEHWLDSWIGPIRRLLKPSASVYICGDWRSSAAVQRVGMRYFTLRNRITWEREKGRGSAINWKNSSEDVWFFTVSEEYVFNAAAVRLKRRVIAPYTENGKPKDWTAEKRGNFRLTAPSNLWNDITVPFWSMPENTDHPTQKPEKLLAKIVLASTNPGDLILDPFAGSGTAPVVAKKLGRDFIGIEADESFCLLAEKRLEMAGADKSIQGFSDGVFWERNTQPKKGG